MHLDRYALKRCLEGLVAHEATIIRYRGHQFYVEPCAGGDLVAEFHCLGGEFCADIYVNEEIPRIFVPAVVGHEIAEADMVINQHISEIEAHQQARLFDLWYAQRTLCDADFMRYFSFALDPEGYLREKRL